MEEEYKINSSILELAKETNDFKKKILVFYNSIWLSYAYSNKFDELLFDVKRSNGQVENGWTIYNPNNSSHDVLLPIDINDYTNELYVTLCKKNDTSTVLTKKISLNELKKQVLEKYDIYEGKYFFLNCFPGYSFIKNNNEIL